ncbi:helix-turn-helix domain-containing protein [Leptolyngbya sp. PL-A3]|uniref:HTH domain-containing protein n=1 Tax=Leptolyngbya sp. PL-A3 TaxID=2933911 RepID=UPI003297F953
MPDLSIRQLAEKLNVSHTAVRNAMADIEAESGIKMGTAQGTGKATLLKESEQAQIAQRFYRPAADAPTGSDGTVLHQAGMTYGIPGLVPHNAHSVQWDLEAIATSKHQHQQTGQNAVLNAAHLVQQFAAFKAVQTIHEIDAVFEGIKASAINQSVSVLGKQSAADPAEPEPSVPSLRS